MIKQKIDEFLLSEDMHYKNLDFGKCVEGFIKEMKSGLNTHSSLEMLPSYVSMDEYDYSNKKAIAVDAGGTNFRVSLISFDKEKNYTIEYLQNYPMPGTYGAMDANAFFDVIAQRLAPIADKARDIGFSFSYPAEITPHRDGIIKYLVKELKVNGAEGLYLGENIKLALKRAKLNDDKNIVVINDTVVALLGGKAAYPTQFSGYIGFILGTGFNSCYVEKSSNIGKISSKKQRDTMIVNMESGGYDKLLRGNLDRELDCSAKDPGVHQLEKMISGAYIGQLARLVFNFAADKGLLGVQTASRINELKDLPTLELSLFLAEPKGQNILAALCANDDDIQMLYGIAEVLIERAAFYTAVVLSASAVMSVKTSDRELCISAEGTTFYRLKNLKEKTTYYLDEYLSRIGLCAQIIKVENSAVTGAAIAALINA
jgi:hexokinase